MWGRHVLSAFGALFTLFATAAPAQKNAIPRLEVLEIVPIHFERNVGQTDASVEYLARGRGYGLFLTRTEAVIAPHAGREPSPRVHPGVLRLRFLGASPNATVTGVGERPGRSHYLKGRDPAGWRTDVPHFAAVRYKEIYPGVDLEFNGRAGHLEYDFLLASGADPASIRLSFDGARRVRLGSEGDLILTVGSGEVIQRLPVVYQDLGGERRRIATRYVIRGDREVRFAVGEHDRSAPLVIDPILEYSTYLGGALDDEPHAVAFDSSGNAYATGRTYSIDFPVAGTPAQPAKAGFTNSTDVFVTKLDPTSALVYSTYFGGVNDDSGAAIAVDGNGNAYVTGFTLSSDFPTAGAPSQGTKAGIPGEADAFVFKLSPTSAPVFSTYLGGGGYEQGLGIAVDGSGNAYVTGYTYSSDFPTAGTPSQPTLGGGRDAFVTKLDPTSQRLYSTYLGGTLDDNGFAIKVNASGNAYLTGWTQSSDFPTAGPPSQPSSGGGDDAFVTKLGPASQRLYSTYLGGVGSDGGTAIAVDSAGNAYVTGRTGSAFFPTAGDPFQPAPGGGFGDDAFVAKLGPTSERLAATYLGGNGFDGGTGIAVDASGFVYVTGSTSSPDFPTAGSPFQVALAGDSDAFVVRMDSNLAMTYSTYLGGTLPDSATGVAVDGSGHAVVVGTTRSNDWPTSGAPAQTTLAGGVDGFVARVFAPLGQGFFTLLPCRVVDTRDPLAGSPLFAGFGRPFAVSGRCGVPVTARAVSANVTVTQPTGPGHLRLYPAGAPLPLASSINYPAGQTRANNAVLWLSPQGRIAVYCGQVSGTAHVVIDVTGYFQ